MDKKNVVISVFVDIKKAFDVVSLDKLLNKLHCLGVQAIFLNLIKTYLSNRQQFVKLDEYKSDILSNNYGVPQGSVLRPFFYSIYVLSLKLANIGARYFAFADDIALVYIGSDRGQLDAQRPR